MRVGRAKGKAAQAVGAAAWHPCAGQGPGCPPGGAGFVTDGSRPPGGVRPLGSARFSAGVAALGGQRLLYLPGTPGKGGAGPWGPPPCCDAHPGRVSPLASPRGHGALLLLLLQQRAKPFAAPNRGPQGFLLISPAVGAALRGVRGGKGGTGWEWGRPGTPSRMAVSWSPCPMARGDGSAGLMGMGWGAEPRWASLRPLALTKKEFGQDFLPLIPAGLLHAAVPCRATLCAPLLLVPAALSSCSGSPR